jgi:hypothetical protein
MDFQANSRQGKFQSLNSAVAFMKCEDGRFFHRQTVFGIEVKAA